VSSFFSELKRRNVFRVGIAYLIGAWLLLQIADVVLIARSLSGRKRGASWIAALS